MIDRRQILIFGAAASILASCAESGPGELALSAQGAIGMNPGPDGTDRPVTVSILQLRSTEAFNMADVFALQDPQANLGADLVSIDQMAVAPGTSAQKLVVAQEGAVAIGLVAGFRDPAGKTYRQVVPIAAGDEKALDISITSSGMSVG